MNAETFESACCSAVSRSKDNLHELRSDGSLSDSLNDTSQVSASMAATQLWILARVDESATASSTSHSVTHQWKKVRLYTAGRKDDGSINLCIRCCSRGPLNLCAARLRFYQISMGKCFRHPSAAIASGNDSSASCTVPVSTESQQRRQTCQIIV